MIETNYPRVTQIISATDSQEKKDRIRKWRKKMDSLHGDDGGKIEIDKIRQNGTDLHEAIANYLVLGAESKHPQFPIIKPFLNVLKKNASIQKARIEQRLYHHKLKFTGQPDLIIDYVGERVVIDWTTTQYPKKKQWLEHKFIQAGAYALMIEELKHEPPIDTLIVVAISPTNYRIFSENPHSWKNEFLNRLQKYNDLDAAQQKGEYYND